jgi:hypothetical protein
MIYQDNQERPSTGLPHTPPPGYRSEGRCDPTLFSPSFQSNNCAHVENCSDLRHLDTVDFYHQVSQYMRPIQPNRRNFIFRIPPDHFRSAMDPAIRFSQDMRFLRRFLFLLIFRMMF